MRTYEVVVRRTGYSEITFKVEAESEDDVVTEAEGQASDFEFPSEYDYDYEVVYLNEIKE